jgi:peptidoglycan/LPS O-acetylase OafA/YrhL
VISRRKSFAIGWQVRFVTISKSQSDLLDLSRWIAAWLVVAEHARAFMFLPGGSTQAGGFASQAFYFATGFGHEAVSIFFVISGYLVGGKVWTQIKEGRFTWRKYLLDRATRLYAVLFVALLLGAALDVVGARHLNAAGLYDLTFSGRMAVLQTPVVTSLTIRDFLINALFLQTILGPTFGSNAPLWSLANEWWYYIFFPAICLLVLPSAQRARVYAVCVLALLAVFLPGKIIILFGVWLLGVVVSLGRKPICPWWLALSLFILVSLAARFDIISGYNFWMYVVGAGFALLLNSLQGVDLRLPARKASKFLADFSYSVYLVHFPVILFLVSGLYVFFENGLRLVFGPSSFVLFAGVFGVAILVAWLVSRFTEAQTPRLRAAVYPYFGSSSSRHI